VCERSGHCQLRRGGGGCKGKARHSGPRRVRRNQHKLPLPGLHTATALQPAVTTSGGVRLLPRLTRDPPTCRVQHRLRGALALGLRDFAAVLVQAWGSGQGSRQPACSSSTTHTGRRRGGSRQQWASHGAPSARTPALHMLQGHHRHLTQLTHHRRVVSSRRAGDRGRAAAAAAAAARRSIAHRLRRAVRPLRAPFTATPPTSPTCWDLGGLSLHSRPARPAAASSGLLQPTKAGGGAAGEHHGG
jgi:hypothetical protein